jgi:MscS family membrane protein
MSPEIKDILSQVYFSNTVGDYLWFLFMMLLAVLFKRIISRYLSNLVYKIFDKHTEGIDKRQLFDLLYRPLTLLILLFIFYIATIHIEFPDEFDYGKFETFRLKNLAHIFYQLLLIISFIWIALRLVDFAGIILLNKAEQTESKQDDQLVAFATEFVKILVVILGIFVIMGAVFKIDIGTLIAGLGIGGLALALAAKESLENLLASFTIFLDKPFVVGDLVQVGGVLGTVEKVGFRSTRIRTLEKSFLTIPNKKMVDTELDNLTLRTFRRARFSVGVTYQTSPEQIAAIIKDIQEYIDEHPNTNQDGKVRFTEFGSSSLDIMVQYFVDTMDWDVYLNVKQEINFKIMEIVKKHNSAFAFPTTTVYLHKNQP